MIMDISKRCSWPSVYRNVLKNQYGIINSWELQQAAQSSKNFIQRLKKWTVLEGHTGCVNTVAWNSSGYLLLTGSDDYLLNIYDFFQNKLIHSIPSGHQANIFSAKFLPCTSDMKIVSCSGDGMLHFNELGSDYGKNYFNCHSGTAYEVLVTPGDPNTYLSCGEDGTIRMFDLRSKTKCHCQECSEDILIDCRHAVTSISVNPMLPYHLAAGCKDSYVRVFDRRMLGISPQTRSVNRNKGWMPGLFCKFKPEKLKKDMSCRITSLQYSEDGKDLLVSYCTDYVYSFTVQDKTGRVMDFTAPNGNGCEIQNSSKHVDYKTADNCDELPPVKRLRLRGDWSDTGPQARPETDEESSSEHNLMQRMSELFSRWLEDAMYSNLRSASTSSDSSHQSVNQDGSIPSEEVSDDHIESRRNSQNCLDDSNITLNTAENIDDGEQTHAGENASVCLCENTSDVLINDARDSGQKSELTETFESQVNYNDDHGHDVNRRGEDFEDNGVSSSALSDEQNSHNFKFQHESILTNDDEGMPCTSQNLVNENTTTRSDENTASESEENGHHHHLHDQVSAQEEEEVSLSATLDDTCDVPPPNRDAAAMRIQNFLRNYKKARNRRMVNHLSKPEKIYLPRTKIKEANFWGADYVVSGSDCGRIFIWNRHTGELIMLLQGDRHVVNCVQPHPYDPILATSGIDHDVKIWAPLAEDEADLSDLDEIVNRNERMLEESRDTITVPASFVLRMLASFGSRRNRRRGAQSRSDVSDTEDDN